MNDEIFLENIHIAIKKRKILQNSMLSIFSLGLIFFVSFNSLQIINYEKLQNEWNFQQLAEKEIYQWEEYPILSEQEKFEYLIEEMELDEFFIEFDEELIEHIKMNGV